MTRSTRSSLLVLACLLSAASAYAEGRGRKLSHDDSGWRYDRPFERRGPENRTSTDQQGRENKAAQAQTGEGNSSQVVQNGDQNRGTVTQTGVNNAGSIRQIGFGNNAGITQNGADNTACIIQVGRRLDTGVVQTGGQSGGVIQTKKGVKEIPAELCLATDFAIGQLKREVFKAR